MSPLQSKAQCPHSSGDLSPAAASPLGSASVGLPSTGIASKEDAEQRLYATEFSDQERAELLRLAHEAISSALQSRELSLHSSNPHLAQPRGVFTTLYLNGKLRGCVGYVLPTSPLYRAVAETARAAACADNRFSPVTEDEAPLLEIELSVLSVPQQIQPEFVEIGRHGLLITQHGHRGLLLPQVPVERNWSLPTFLEQTCLKAGLPSDAWQKGAMIEAFSAEIFNDKHKS
jgi:AmmeMemoRadiSam system protein A